MEALIKNLNSNDKYIEFKNILKLNKNNSLSTIGLTDSAKAMFVYNITKSLDKSSVIICNNVFQANKMVQDLKFFSNDIEIIFLPSKSIEYYDVEAESKEIENQRAYAIQRILDGSKNIIVTTIDAVLINMKPRSSFDKLNININLEQKINLQELVQNLNDLRISKIRNC